MEILILVTDQCVEMVLAILAVPGQELLGVHDGPAHLAQHHTTSGSSTAGLMVHVTEVTGGVFLHCEVACEFEAVRKGDLSEDLRSPCLVVECGLVGLGLPQEVAVEVRSYSLSVTKG